MEEGQVVGRTKWVFGWIGIAVGVLLALLLDVVWIDLYDRLWVIGLLFPLSLWLGAVWLAVSIAARGFRAGAWRPAVALLAVLVAAAALQWLGADRIRVLARFHALRPRYQAIVRTIETGDVPPARTHYIMDKGQPVRVAFPWPGGLLDNWCGVVYDPSGLVRKASRFRSDLSNFRAPALQDVRMLFGGMIRSCEPLGVTGISVVLHDSSAIAADDGGCGPPFSTRT